MEAFHELIKKVLQVARADHCSRSLNRRALAVALLSMAYTSASRADVVSLELTGMIGNDSAYVQQWQVANGILPNEMATATLTYDTSLFAQVPLNYNTSLYTPAATSEWLATAPTAGTLSISLGSNTYYANDALVFAAPNQIAFVFSPLSLTLSSSGACAATASIAANGGAFCAILLFTRTALGTGQLPSIGGGDFVGGFLDYYNSVNPYQATAEGFNLTSIAAVSAVPELSTWAMLLLGFAGLEMLRSAGRCGRQSRAARPTEPQSHESYATILARVVLINQFLARS